MNIEKKEADRCFWIENNKEDIIDIIKLYEEWNKKDECETLGLACNDFFDKKMKEICKLKKDINDLTPEKILSGAFTGLARVKLLKEIFEWLIKSPNQREEFIVIAKAGIEEYLY